MMLCRCHSKQYYEQCCGLFIENKKIPQTPEKLMRSRYTAYTQANMDYIQKTMTGPAIKNFDSNEAKQWAKTAEWVGLRIVKALPPKNNIGYVTFIARYKLNGQIKLIKECSEFHYIDGRWFYYDGVNE